MATTEFNYPNSYNRELILDLTLQAFYVYDLDVEGNRVHDYVPISKTVKEDVEVVLLDNDGEIVVDGSMVNVTTQETITSNRTRDPRNENFKLLTSTTDREITLSEYRDYNFLDFISADDVGKNFRSYLLTGQDVSEDFANKKQSVYLMTYFFQTEKVYSGDGAGGVVLRIPSSCKVQARWNWNVTDTQGKFGVEFEAYKLKGKLPAGVAGGDLFTYGQSVIDTRHKIRGRGRALQLYFSSTAGKDLILLGWSILGSKNDVP